MANNIKFPTQEEVETKTPEEILAKGAKKSDTEAKKAQIQAGIIKAQEQISTIQAGISSLAEIDTTGAPVIDTNAGDTTAVSNGLIAQDAQMRTLIETLTKQSEEAAKRAATAQKGILGAITKRAEAREAMPSVEELTKTTLAEYGLTPESVQKVQGWMGQLATYNQQLANLQAQTQQGMVNIEQRLQGRPGVIVRGEQALYEKQQNIRISSVAAQAGVVAQQIQMERGLWTDARSTANMIVSAATYDQQQEVADLDWALDTYKDLYDMATTEEQTAWNRAYTVAKDELTKQQDDWKEKLDLNQRAAEAGVSLGWDSTYMESHTIEELNAEYSERVAKVAAEPEVSTQIIGSAETGYQVVTIDKKTGKVIRTAPVGIAGLPGVEGVEQEIEIYARQLQAGAILPSNVPQRIRGKVLVKQQEFIMEDLRNDILTAKERNDYGTTADLKTRLHEVYKEVDPADIDAEVDGLIPIVPPTPPVTAEEQAERAGEAITEAAPFFGEALKETLAKPYVRAYEVTAGFFRGLFGR